MYAPTRLMRLSLLLATTSLTLGACIPAFAQPAAPPGAEQAGDPNVDPPALAGRIADIHGTVSFHSAGETQWSAATLNYPVTNGESYWTEPQAQATLEIADDRLVMDSSTELDMGAIDASQIVITEPQGASFLNLASLQPNQTVTFNTPRGAVQITQPGIYEIVAGDTNDATMITVVQGAAHITGTNLELDVAAQQTATIGGSDTLQGSVGQIEQDAFLQSMLRAPARRHFAAAVPRQVQYMTGAADLQTYGNFTQTQQYGQVWYPNNVARNWAPYRDGHWSYVQPWGWTWVDNARWGFAPFHYGRWVQVNDRWGWVAGEEAASVEVGVSAYPVYSPALVSFVDVGGAALAGASISFGVGGYAPAWIPLGPREPYYPWYHVRSDYFARVNAPYGVPREIIQRGPTYNYRDTTVVNNTTINRNVFINQRFATVAPAAAFTRGQQLQGIARPLPVGALEHARPIYGRLPVAPTAETPNLPRAAARRYNVSLPERPVHAALAGPRIAPEGERVRAVPELRRAGPPPGVRAVPAGEVRNGQAPGGQVGRNGDLRGRPGNEVPGQNAGRGLNERGQPQRNDVPGAVGSARGPGAREPGAREPGSREPGALPGLRAPGAGRPAVPPQIGGQRGGPDNRLPKEGRAPNPAETNRGEVPRPGAPGPALRAGGQGRPDLNRPPARAEAPRPGVGGEALRPGERNPNLNRPAPGRPEQTRPEQSRPEQSRPEQARPEQARPEQARPGQARPEQGRPAPGRPAPHAEAPRPEPRVQAPRPEQHPQMQRPAPRAEAPRPAPRPEPQRMVPRPEAPRPAPHAEAPRPAPRPEAPRPAPHVEAPRPQPHAEAPRPAPRPPAPRPEAPRPPPRAEAPHPAPRAEPPHPGPRPGPEHKQPPGH